MACSSQRLVWSPKNIISLNNKKFQYVCIVLNRKIKIPKEVVYNLWENAKSRILVDGGANQWRQFIETHCNDRESTVSRPDLITGDFDSITKETLEYFQSTKRVHTPDQDATDFTKAINVIRPVMEKEKINNIVVFHDNSGRFDHLMANINTLHKLQSSTLNVYLLSGSCLTWLLRPGKHSINVPSELVHRKRWCALMPIGAPAKSVTTKGLQWDLCNSELVFGGMVSTSNTYKSEEIEVEADSCLVWSMGLFCFDEAC